MPAKRRGKAAEPPSPPQIRLFHPAPPFPPVDADGRVLDAAAAPEEAAGETGSALDSEVPRDGDTGEPDAG